MTYWVANGGSVAPGPGGGEVNDLDNLGVGHGWYSHKDGLIMYLKSLLAGTNINIDVLTNELRINAISPFAHIYNVMDYGAVGDGVADDRGAIQAAIDAAVADPKGGKVYMPPGKYKIVGLPTATEIWEGKTLENGIHIPDYRNTITTTEPRVQLLGAGPGLTHLIPVRSNTANAMFTVRCELAYAEVGGFSINGEIPNTNTTDHVIGLAVVPNHVNSPTQVARYSYGFYHSIKMERCSEGILMMGGWDGVSGDRGQHYWCTFMNIIMRRGRRGIYLADKISGASIVNSNLFIQCQVQHSNAAYYIEGGDTNTFVHCTADNIQFGTFPLATPTGTYILRTPPVNTQFGNEQNRFYSCPNEDSTRNAWIDGRGTEIYGYTWESSKNDFFCDDMSIWTSHWFKPVGWTASERDFLWPNGAPFGGLTFYNTTDGRLETWDGSANWKSGNTIVHTP